MDKGINFWKFYNSNLPANIMVIGKTNCDKNYHIHRENSGINALEIITSGSGILEINGKTYYPGKNSVIFLPKGSSHNYYTDETELWQKKWVVFDGPVLEALCKGYLPQDEYCFADCDVLCYFNELEALSQKYENNYPRLTEKCAIVIHRMLARIKNASGSRLMSVAERIRMSLDSKVEQQLSLDEIADEIGYSKNYIIRIFSETYGVTPYRYFMERKIEAAKLYLINTPLSVGEIAMELNFADSHYFSNCFKKLCGISPKDFRKSNRGNEYTIQGISRDWKCISGV